MNRVDKGPMAGVSIYIFKTVGDGVYEYKRAEQMYETGYVPEGLIREVMSQQDGMYEATLPSGGSLLFYKHPYKPVLVKVRGRNRHDVVIEGTRELKEAVLVEQGRKMTKKGKTVSYGDKFTVKDFPYFLDKTKMGEVEGIGKTNARLIAQVFITDSEGRDTMKYFMPRVYDGTQFHQTQYHWRKDIMYDIADRLPPLDAQKDSLTFNVSFRVDRPEDMFFCKAHIWIEDYIKTYYRDTIELLNTGRVSRPFQFIDYPHTPSSLDPKDYFKEPRREMLATPKTLKLKFRVGSAELERSDKATTSALDSLKSELRQVMSDPAATLKEIHFKGYASPDGMYSKNKVLSEKRTQTVLNNVISGLSGYNLSRVYRTSAGFVSPWSEVADILEADSLSAEASLVRKIVAAYPGDLDAQGARIRRLKVYRSKIAPYLEDLRVVKCEYMYEILRYLTPEEIHFRYLTDEDYRMGRKPLTLNEYWHLFNLIDNKQELESLYRRALKDSYEIEREYWALPANSLAVMYLERGQADTTLLKPFINENRGLNYSEMDMDTGKRKIVNAEPVIMNQVLMFMLEKNYVRAEELSSILENTQPLLRSIVRCVGGFLDLENPKDLQLVDIIRQSSVRNHVIINLFLERFDETTIAALNALPREEAMTSYLKAQRLCLQYSNQVYVMKSEDFKREEDPALEYPDMDIVPCSVYDAAYTYLKTCFEKDAGFIAVAKRDADINEDLLNDVLGIRKERK